MNPHNDDHARDPGRSRREGEIARTNTRLNRRFPRRHARALGVLLLALNLLPPMVVAATARQATPSPAESTLPDEVTVDLLIEATLEWHTLPRALNTLALSRATLPPGAEATTLNGAHLFFVESGALTVQAHARAYGPPTGTPGPVHVDAAAGPPVTHRAGDQFLVSYDVASSPTIANEGAEPAVALVVSIAVRSPSSTGEPLTGGAVVEPLAVAGAARVGPPLLTAGKLGAAPISVALVRASYERGANFDIGEPAARLLTVESGALNVLVADPAFYAPADAAGKPLPPDARVSLAPGDQLLAPAPGRISTRNVARGLSAVLIVTVGTAAAVTVQR
ncbi:MAG: hypothetical protein ACRDJH_00020 [Thermomicrobiales bacterium]